MIKIKEHIINEELLCGIAYDKNKMTIDVGFTGRVDLLIIEGITPAEWEKFVEYMVMMGMDVII